MLLALSVSAGAVIFAAFLFGALFRYIRPEIIAVDYHACSGGWYEAELLHCGQGLTELPQQPINTYTNLAYLAAGLYPGVLVGTPVAYVFAFTMAYLCLGSALYHGTSTRWSGMLDVTAIYVVFSALAVYAAAELINLPPWMTPGLMFVIPGSVAYVLSPRYHQNMRAIIGIFLGGAYALLIIQMWVRGLWGAWPFLVMSLAAFGLAYVFWTMDKKRTFPFPRWGHGFWHILTAIASGMLFYAIYLTS